MTFKGYQRGDGMQINGGKQMPDTTEQSTDAISLQRRPNMKTTVSLFVHAGTWLQRRRLEPKQAGSLESARARADTGGR